MNFLAHLRLRKDKMAKIMPQVEVIDISYMGYYIRNFDNPSYMTLKIPSRYKTL